MNKLVLTALAGVVVAGSQIGILAVSGAIAAPEPRSRTGANSTDMNQVICRRDSVAGSRVQTRRTCKTRREWIKDNDQLRDSWAEFMRKANGGVPNMK